MSHCKIKVLVAYPYIMHYRKPVFEEMLINEHDINFRFLADEKSNIKSLPVLQHTIESCGNPLYSSWTVTKNIWIGKHFLWQTSLTSQSIFSDYDVLLILGNMYYFSNWFALLFAKLRRKKVLMWTHGVRDKETGFKGLLRRFFYKCSDGLLLYGYRAKQILTDCGLSNLKMHVIYNSLDFDHQKKIINTLTENEIKKKKVELGILENELTILCIGRLTPDKKIPFLVDALEILNTKNIAFKAIIVGDGPDRDKLIEKVHNSNLTEKVILYGACYCETDIALLHSISDVSVMPGDIGLSVIHSLTYGIPVITHDNFSKHKPEFEAITPGITGDFYSDGSADSLASHILKWAASSKNEKDTIVRNCKDVVDRLYNPKNQELLISEAIISAFETP